MKKKTDMQKFDEAWIRLLKSLPKDFESRWYKLENTKRHYMTIDCEFGVIDFWPSKEWLEKSQYKKP